MTTIKDIAKLTGVSVGTVSRVINNKPDVKEHTRQKVLQAIEDLHFEPNTNAKLLKQKNQDNITIIVKGIGRLVLEDLLEKTQTLLREAGQDSNALFIDDSENEIATALRLYRERNPKAFIFINGSRHLFRDNFNQITCPCVLIGKDASKLEYPLLSSVYSDEYEGSKMASDVFVRTNHKNVGVIARWAFTDNVGNVSSPRLEGLVDHLKANNIDFDIEKQVSHCEFTLESAYNATKTLMKQAPETTAIFAQADNLAIAAIRALNDMKLKVPGDVSIIGYNGAELTQYVSPRITSIKLDTDTLSKIAVKDILNRLENPEAETIHEKVELQLIEGESVKTLK